MQSIKSSPIIDRAKSEVTDFCSMFERLEQKVILGGLSNSTLLNYGRCIAKISLHFKCIPTQLEEEQINGYLQFLLTGQKPSRSYFKHTVYGISFNKMLHFKIQSRGFKIYSCCGYSFQLREIFIF